MRVLFFVGFWVLFFLNPVHSQRQYNVWYFGHECGINFNFYPPFEMSGFNEQSTWEGCASIADSNGILLFYSDGVNVRNINTGANIMPNGAGLTGSSTSAQSALIVPHPDNVSQYYLFTLSPGPYVGATPQEASYSIVDMNRAGGLGDVIPATKNTGVYSRVSEGMAAVMMPDCRAFWLVLKDWNSNDYSCFPVTAGGIGTPVRSAGPNYVGDSQGTNASINIIKSSGDGLKLACTHFQSDVVDLMDFNNGTGVMSNFMTLQMPVGSNPYGLAFSPDNSRLYVTTGGATNGQLFQYDLSSGVEATINASRTMVYMSSIPLGDMALAVDGDIYVAKSGFTSLGVIRRPNHLGAACAYAPTGYSMNHPARRGLPNIVQQLSTGTCTPNPLAVELLAFSVETSENGSLLNWESSNERGHSYFAVERSANGKDFMQIGSNPAMNNDQSGSRLYSFVDSNLSPGQVDAWYRLKMVDINGSYEYSEIRYLQVNPQEFAPLSGLGPNPVPRGQSAHAALNLNESSTVLIYLSDFTGRILWQEDLTLAAGKHELEIPCDNLATGMYLLKVGSQQGTQTERIMVF